MVFKINISSKEGKTYKLELESEDLIGKMLHDKIKGTDVLPALEGYELEITGTSDKSGFTSHKDVEGIGLKKVLLTEYGKGLKFKPRREGKKKLTNPTPKGLRLRRSMRGRIISPAITQINMKIVKEGSKPLTEAFPDQNKAKVEEVKVEVPAQPAEAPVQEAPKEEAKPAEESKPEEKPVEETKVEEKPAKANDVDNDKTPNKGETIEKDNLEKPVQENVPEEKSEEKPVEEVKKEPVEEKDE